MNPVFVGGIIIGALVTVAALAIAVNYWRRPTREPEDWTDEFHEPEPVVRTRLLIHERTFEL